MSEIEVLVHSLRAARNANIASINSIDAALKLLSEDVSPPAQKEELEPALQGCQHEKAEEVESGAGRFLVCPCGHQEQLS